MSEFSKRGKETLNLLLNFLIFAFILFGAAMIFVGIVIILELCFRPMLGEYAVLVPFGLMLLAIEIEARFVTDIVVDLFKWFKWQFIEPFKKKDNNVKCDYCGEVVQKKDAEETKWDLDNGDSIKWYYCKECIDKGIFNGGKRNGKDQTLED